MAASNSSIVESALIRAPKRSSADLRFTPVGHVAI